MKKLFRITGRVFQDRGEPFRYVLVGGSAALLNVVSYTLLCKTFDCPVNISNIISILLATLAAYIGNKLFVFRSHCPSKTDLIREFLRFFGGRLITMLIEVAGVILAVNVIGQDEVVGKLETQIVVYIVNYVLSRYVVFPRGR